jgi:hypothetical protein
MLKDIDRDPSQRAMRRYCDRWCYWGDDEQTQVQQVKNDPAMQALYTANYGRANQVANIPFTPYTGERVASYSPLEQFGRQSILDWASDKTAPTNLDQAASTFRTGTTAKLDPTAFLNPYTDSVVKTSLDDLARARDIQRVSDNQSATRAGAFGGSRQGVADSLTNDAYLRNVASTSANLRSGAYDRAMTTALNDAGLKLRAGEGLAQVSQQQDALGRTRSGAVQALGEQDRTLQQARDDAAYQEFMRMLGYPAETQQILDRSLGLIPNQTTNTSTSSRSPGTGSVLSGVGSLGLGLAQIGDNLGWFDDGLDFSFGSNWF